MSLNNISYSIVIPCYNERDRLPSTLRSVIAHMQERRPSAEIIVVDDGSSDGTSDWVRSQTAGTIPIQVISYNPNRGKGYAVKTGMLAANGDFILFMDADGATDITEAEKMWPLLESGRADMVIGSRALTESKLVATQSFWRRQAAELFGGMVDALLFYGIQDTQCGFKMFTQRSCKIIFSKLTVESALFDIEAILLAYEADCRIKELPVTWEHDGDTRIAYNFRRICRVWSELFGIKWRHRIFWPRHIKG